MRRFRACPEVCFSEVFHRTYEMAQTTFITTSKPPKVPNRPIVILSVGQALGPGCQLGNGVFFSSTLFMHRMLLLWGMAPEPLLWLSLGRWVGGEGVVLHAWKNRRKNAFSVYRHGPVFQDRETTKLRGHGKRKEPFSPTEKNPSHQLFPEGTEIMFLSCLDTLCYSSDEPGL